jgi:NADH-quinone oxidoreductase subunit G
VQDKKGPLFILHTFPTKLDELAAVVQRGAPDNLARIAFALAVKLGAEVSPIDDLHDDEKTLVDQMAEALLAAKNPLIIGGYGSGYDHFMKAAANIAWALQQQGRTPMLSFTLPECNSLGLEMLGGHRLDSAIDLMEKGGADTIIILENDLYRRADEHVIDSLFAHAKEVILIDHLYNQTAEKATAILPAGTFAEADGTIVNNEGRAQRFFQVFVPKGSVQESWRWLLQIAEKARIPSLNGLENLDDIVWALSSAVPFFEKVQQIAPHADFRINGQKIPRESHRYSGRTAILADVSVSEPKPADDIDTPLSFTMEGFRGVPPAPLIPYFWSPGWNSVQAVNKYQSEIGGHLHGGDPGLRLLEPRTNGKPHYFSEAPEKYVPIPGHVHVMPMYSIFGSEELSMYTKGIAQSAKDFFCMYMNPEDMHQWGISPGVWVSFDIDHHVYQLVAVPHHWLPRGIAGLNAGLPRSKVIDLPQCVKLSGSEALHATQ